MKTLESVKFKKIGSKKQHAVTLFDILKLPFDLEKCQQTTTSFSEDRINYYFRQSIEYLKTKNIDEIDGLFYVSGKNIEKWSEGKAPNFSAMPLWAAIEERDKKSGQSGEFLAALITHKCRLLETALYDAAINNKHKELGGVILDISMKIQELFFRLHLLEKIHLQYSAGKFRVDKANQEHDLTKKFLKEAEIIYSKHRKSNNKERSYALTAEELEDVYPEEKTPTTATIKRWLKSRKDLP